MLLTYLRGIAFLVLFSLQNFAVKGQSIKVTADATQNPASVSEWSMTKTGLIDIHCTDVKSGNTAACTCSVMSTTPANGPFDVQQNIGKTYPQVYYTGTGLSTGVTSYSVSVTCVNTALPSERGVTIGVTVNISPDLPPFFNVYPAVTAGTVNARSSKVGDTVYTAKATDPENNAITYNMTQSPDDGYFDINAATGAITINKSLMTTTNSTYTLTVYACDIQKCGRDQIVHIPLTNLNTLPKFDNLPAVINLPETTSGGTVIETVTITDADGDTVDTTCSVNPASESFKFVYEINTQRLRLATLSSTTTATQPLLDFDQGTIKYIITCVASDGFLSSQSTVTVNVENVNEPPTFQENMYYCDMDESKAGVSHCTLGLSVTDPDGTQTAGLTYSLLPGNNSQRFSYSNDQLTFAVNYDVDNNAMPQKSIITIQAKDALGLTGTSQITVNVADVNDKVCRFSNQILASTINQGTSLGSLGTFAATDDDLTSPNNKVTYQLAGGSSNYMYVFSTGEVHYSQQIPESEHGRTFYLQVRCLDGGVPVQSATATFALTYVTTTTKTTTTTTTTTVAPTPAPTQPSSSSSNLFDNDAFVGVFAALMTLLILGLIGLLVYCCCCAGNGSQQREPLTQVKPYRDEYDYSPSRESRYSGGRDEGRYSRGRSYGPVTPSGIRALPSSGY